MAEQRGADDIVEVFNSHIAQIEVVPVNADGKPNLSMLARTCGFDRKRFNTNPRLGKALHDAVKEKGLAPINQVSSEDKRLREAKNEIKNLRERIDVMQAEIKAGKDRIKRLEQAIENRAGEDILYRAADIFLDTGRMPR